MDEFSPTGNKFNYMVRVTDKLTNELDFYCPKMNTYIIME